MATLTIKNLPAPLYERLKEKAASNRRSINSEAIIAVEQAVADFGTVAPEAMRASLRRARSRLDRVFVTEADLRAARAEGRA